jgi:hypothetical protein
VSHHRRERAAPRGQNAFLLYDIDDELEGWENDDEHLADGGAQEAVTPSPAPEACQGVSELSGNTDGGMAEPSANWHADAQDSAAEEVWDDDDGLFESLTATQANNSEEPEGDQEHETLYPDWDWGELDEFDPVDDEEADDSSEHITIDPAHNRIALHSKSQRAAAKIIKDANWERDEGLPVLTEILIHHHCHPKTIGALRKLTIEHRVEPEMLRTLHEIRSAWRSHGYNRVYSAFGAGDGWTNLPWGIALHITETLGVQSENEVMEFCGVCFNDWCEVGFPEFPIFAYYLNFVVSTIDSPLADTIHAAPDTARAMLTDRGEQYDLPGNPVDQDLEYYGIT